ncbi:sialate O-acetylesterase [Neoaquamicrobium sediminum]|uniref:Tail fiber protein n=2 Tax=root TaxID=1 RepID=A0AB38ZLN1_9VIRU
MTIRVFVSGQSNALGRGFAGPDWSAIDSRVRVWNNVNPLGLNGSAFVSAPAARIAGTFQLEDRNNAAVWFAHRLAIVRDDDVDVTLVARSGAPISNWAPGEATYPLLQECIDVYAATGQPPADVFMWHQGESDVFAASATYRSAFLDLLANLTAADVIDSNTIVIVGGLLEDNSSRIDFNNNALKALAAENAQIYYSSSAGLTSEDEVHFDGNSLYYMGVERYFAAYAEAEGFNMADLFALVNEGGTPGVPGTGENKLYNLLNLALIGMGKKNVTLPPDFDGALPGDNFLTSAMVAAGSVVEHGTTANGSFVRLESGIQVCWHIVQLAYSQGGLLNALWTFPKAYNAQPAVLWTGGAKATLQTGMTAAEKGTSFTETFPTSGQELVSTNIRMVNSATPFTSGDTYGASVLAIGFWK